jgi:hypothetical protein
MNEIMEEYGLNFKVYQQGGNWYVTKRSSYYSLPYYYRIPFYDGMILSIEREFEGF